MTELNHMKDKVAQAIREKETFDWSKCEEGEPSLFHMIALWINRKLHVLPNYRAFKYLDADAKEVKNSFYSAIKVLNRAGQKVFWGQGATPPDTNEIKFDKRHRTHFVTIDSEYQSNGIVAELADFKRSLDPPRRAIAHFISQISEKHPDKQEILFASKHYRKQLETFTDATMLPEE